MLFFLSPAFSARGQSVPVLFDVLFHLAGQFALLVFEYPAYLMG